MGVLWFCTPKKTDHKLVRSSPSTFLRTNHAEDTSPRLVALLTKLVLLIFNKVANASSAKQRNTAVWRSAYAASTHQRGLKARGIREGERLVVVDTVAARRATSSIESFVVRDCEVNASRNFLRFGNARLKGGRVPSTNHDRIHLSLLGLLDSRRPPKRTIIHT